MRPVKVNMMSRPRLAILRSWPLRKPSPRPTSSRSEPTPQAMPNMVRNERSLWAHRVDRDWRTISRRVRIDFVGGVNRLRWPPYVRLQPPRAAAGGLASGREVSVPRLVVYIYAYSIYAETP